MREYCALYKFINKRKILPKYFPPGFCKTFWHWYQDWQWWMPVQWLSAQLNLSDPQIALLSIIPLHPCHSFFTSNCIFVYILLICCKYITNYIPLVHKNNNIHILHKIIYTARKCILGSNFNVILIFLSISMCPKP